MAGTITSDNANIDTILNKAGSGGTNIKVGSTATYVGGSVSQNLVKGVAKLTGHIENAASSFTLNAASSLNISSAVDAHSSSTAAGVNTINATNPFSAVLAAAAVGSINDQSYNRGLNIGNMSTSEFRTRSFTTSSGGVQDSDTDIAVAFFGDLA